MINLRHARIVKFHKKKNKIKYKNLLIPNSIAHVQYQKKEERLEVIRTDWSKIELNLEFLIKRIQKKAKKMIKIISKDGKKLSSKRR